MNREFCKVLGFICDSKGVSVRSQGARYTTLLTVSKVTSFLGRCRCEQNSVNVKIFSLLKL